MKKLYLFFVFASFAMLPFLSNGQNLVNNGDLEQWDDANTPTGWDLYENISQSTDPVHGGTYSAGHMSASSSKKFRQDIQGIVGGQQYTISYYYYDNAPNAKTRIWSYWMDAGGNYLDDDADVLRPAVYSDDKPSWQQFNVTLTAPSNAAQFRMEVRVYHQDNTEGGYVYYDDFDIEASSTNFPEPTNYPTDFTATASGVDIDLTWVDAIGEQLPGAYLILGHEGTSTSFTAPVDGVPVGDDLDWSDGEVAVNVSYGVQAYSFNNLIPGQDYTFIIYPYTNAGSNIDYKTDGNPPTATAQVNDVVIINQEDFESGTLGTWTEYNVTGTQIWENYEFGGNKFARMSGYEGGSNENEDWLISPQMDFTNFISITMNFSSAVNYTGPDLQLFISTDYDGTGNPNDFTWTELTGDATWSDGSFNWVESGDVDLTAYTGESVYVAYKYTSTADESATWEIDDILIYGIHTVGINESKHTELGFYPNPASNFIQFTENRQGKLSVFDFAGRNVMTVEVNKGTSRIDVSSLGTGTYLVRFNDNNNKIKTGKLIVR